MFPSPASVRWSSSAAFSGARRPASRSPSPLRREGGDERLLADARAEVGLELARLEQEPGAEAAHVAVADLGAVVEPDDRAHVRGRGGLARGGVPVMRRWIRSARPDAKRRIRYLPRRSTPLDALAGELRARPRAGPPAASAATSSISTRSKRAALERRRDRAPHRLDLGQLRHRAAAGRSPDRPRARAWTGRRRRAGAPARPPRGSARPAVRARARSRSAKPKRG